MRFHTPRIQNTTPAGEMQTGNPKKVRKKPQKQFFADAISYRADRRISGCSPLRFVA